MALNRNPYAAYGNNRVLTASPAELTLLLYDGAIKFCNLALTAMEQGNIEKTNLNIKKAERIIEEFQSTLDTRYEVSKDFANVYAYIDGLLIRANIHKEKAPLEEALVHIRTMRDTWKEVMKKS